MTDREIIKRAIDNAHFGIDALKAIGRMVLSLSSPLMDIACLRADVAQFRAVIDEYRKGPLASNGSYTLDASPPPAEMETVAAFCLRYRNGPHPPLEEMVRARDAQWRARLESLEAKLSDARGALKKISKHLSNTDAHTASEMRLIAHDALMRPSAS